LLLIGFLGCSGDVETEVRTLQPSGRQVEIFRIFAQEGLPDGTAVNYFYFSRHFGDHVAFEQEWSAILPDALREAEEHKARQLFLIASEKGRGLLSLLTRRGIHSWLYRHDGKDWRKIRED